MSKYTTKNKVVAIKFDDKVYDFEKEVLKPATIEILNKFGEICVEEIRKVIQSGAGIGGNPPYDTGTLYTSIHYVVGGENDTNRTGSMITPYAIHIPGLKSGAKKNRHAGIPIPTLSAEENTMRVGTTLKYGYQIEFGKGGHEKIGKRPFITRGVLNAVPKLKHGAFQAVSTYIHRVR